jgi:hypothetical protein
MSFPKKVETEDMGLCMKTWRLAGYVVHEFENTPVSTEKPNIWASDKVNHPGEVGHVSQISALYTYRGDHYLRLHPIEEQFDGMA